MVSGKPYISTKRATMKAEKAPSDRQSSLVLGFDETEGEKDKDGRIDDDQRP